MEKPPQDEPPVSFQELKKRWAQQEAGSRQQEPSVSGLPAKTPSIRTSSPQSQSSHSINSLDAEPSLVKPSQIATTQSTRPPVPPKPSSVTTNSSSPSPIVPEPRSVTEKLQQKDVNPKRVSLLAKQFDQQNPATEPSSTPKLGTGNMPEKSMSASDVPTIGRESNSAESTRPASVAVVEGMSQDPFSDEEAMSSDSDSEEESDTNSTSSEDNINDEQLIRKVQETHIRYTTSETEQLFSTNRPGVAPSKLTPAMTKTTRTPPPPPPPKSLHKPKLPPPPPPPSKKYHSSARAMPVSATSTCLQASPSSASVLTPPNSSMNIPSPMQSIPEQSMKTSSQSPWISPPILPPRPTAYSVQPVEPATVPQLPPRPSVSLGRSHTVMASSSHSTLSGNHERNSSLLPGVPLSSSALDEKQQPLSALKRSQTTNIKRVTARPEVLMTSCTYPDLSQASRKPPYLEYDRRIVSGHRGTVHAVAASGSYLATGSHTTRIWDMNSCQCIYSIDPSAPNDAGDKVRALMFAPAPNVADDGRHLWVGMQDGVIMVLDSITGAILGKRTTSHSHAICFILRYRNTEMWTLDESGILNMWPVLTVDCERNHPLEMTPQKHMVAARTVAALIVGTSLWTSSGRTLDVFHFAHHGSDSPHIRIPNDVGNITQLVTVPYHKKLVFASHDDGKITVWDTETVEKVQVITISMYGICSMAAAGEFYLWTGYNTGMIYVYDTRPEKWVAVKIWKAHNTAVTTLMVDESGFSRDEKSMQVISADSNGCVATWDGLLTETWQDAQLEKHVRDYCSYRNVRVAICSWNIDANKPEKLVGNDNDKIYEWLGQMDDPDIIVVGIQEIVDLESKKQTARSLFASRKKIETLQEAEELLTHRYRLWHDHLVRVIGDNYGANAYTVIKTDQLVGLFSCVFVKTSEVNRVINCDSTLVKTGMKLMNKSLHGNKGGIAIRFLFDHSSLCFINCHLAAGQSHSQQRNADAEGILQTATFPELRDYCDVFAHGGDGTLVLDHEHCFLSGDLNYRINMTREKVLQLLASHDKEKAWRTLQQKDQLLMQRITNPLFKLLTFQEAPIQFDPTYKYDPGTDFYDRSEKKRIPAWCDRVLYRSRHAQNLYYQRHEVRASDHRPISAGFVIQTKIIDGEKRDQLMDKIEMVWQDSLERLVRDKKAQYVADYELCNLQEARQLLETKHWDVQEVVMNLRSAN